MIKTRAYGLVIVIVLAMGLLMSACGREFEPYWKIQSLRVMGIQVDPVSVKQGQTARIRALLYAPENQDVQYQWSWCPVRSRAQNDYECPLTAEQIGQFLDAMNSEDEQSEYNNDSPPQWMENFSFELGTDPEVEFFNPFTTEMILGFCQAIQEQVAQASISPELEALIPATNCEQGYEVYVRLQVTSGDSQIITNKAFELWTGSEQFNANPRIADMQIRPAKPEDTDKIKVSLGWLEDAPADHDEQWVSLAQEQPVEIVSGIPFEVRALVDPDSVQMWVPPKPRGMADDDYEPQEISEALDYTWFTTAGDIERSRRVFLVSSNTLDDASNTVFTVAEDDLNGQCIGEPDNTDCQIQLWNVVRDGRLGIDWIERQLVVVDHF